MPLPGLTAPGERHEAKYVTAGIALSGSDCAGYAASATSGDTSSPVRLCGGHVVPNPRRRVVQQHSAREEFGRAQAQFGLPTCVRTGCGQAQTGVETVGFQDDLAA